VHPFVLGILLSSLDTHQTRKDTNNGVFSCSASFLHSQAHAKHEQIPTKVSFHTWHLSLNLGQPPPSSSTIFQHEQRAQKDTFVDVLSCLASFPHSWTHAEHKKTPLLVSFHAWCLSFTHRHTPNTNRHQQRCLFMLGIFPSTPDACQFSVISPVLVYVLKFIVFDLIIIIFPQTND
jgi:hypothetical protein